MTFSLLIHRSRVPAAFLIPVLPSRIPCLPGLPGQPCPDLLTPSLPIPELSALITTASRGRPCVLNLLAHTITCSSSLCSSLDASCPNMVWVLVGKCEATLLSSLLWLPLPPQVKSSACPVSHLPADPWIALPFLVFWLYPAPWLLVYPDLWGYMPCALSFPPKSPYLPLLSTVASA